jgi:hypothetical protein
MSDSPNLDLIQRVQAARMQHDKNAQPSQISGVYWIEAKAIEFPVPTPRSGQWIIMTTLAEVDHLWAKVKEANEAGQLGYKSKVSTAVAPGQTDPNARLIYVCTCDSADEADVLRVGEALRTLGITDELRRYVT